MKYILSLMVATLLFSSCKKDINACKDYKEITGREQGVDLASIHLQEFRDTLSKYPQLEVYQSNSDQYSNSINCHVYYQGLLVFSDEYNLFKSSTTSSVTSSGEMLSTPLSISLEPTTSYKDAIQKAKYSVNLDHSCISYQLGLYNLNRWYNMPADYKLAWKIMDSQKSYIYVIVDAVTNSIIIADNGIRYQ